MDFQLVNIEADSRLINFIFRNNDIELVVKTSNGDMFIPNAIYNIKITQNLDITTTCAFLGVVTHKTCKSVRIACGSILWIVPPNMCLFNPGIDVWIYVRCIL
jgi:hypothetical protein